MRLELQRVISGEASKNEMIEFVLEQAERRMMLSNYEIGRNARLVEARLSMANRDMITGEYNPGCTYKTTYTEKSFNRSRELFHEFYREYGKRFLAGVDEKTAFWRLVFFYVYLNEWFAYLNWAVNSLLLEETAPEYVEKRHQVLGTTLPGDKIYEIFLECGGKVDLDEELQVTKIRDDIGLVYVKQNAPVVKPMVDLIESWFKGGSYYSEDGICLALPPEMIDRRRRGGVVYLISSLAEGFATFGKIKGEKSTLVELPLLTLDVTGNKLCTEGESLFFGLVHEDKHVEVGSVYGRIDIAAVNEMVTLAYEVTTMERLGVTGREYEFSLSLLEPFILQAVEGRGKLDHVAMLKIVRFVEGLKALDTDKRKLVIDAIMRI